MKRRKNAAVEMVRGAVAGGVGVWAMDRVGWFLYNREDPAALRREHVAVGVVTAGVVRLLSRGR